MDVVVQCAVHEDWAMVTRSLRVDSTNVAIVKPCPKCVEEAGKKVRPTVLCSAHNEPLGYCSGVSDDRLVLHVGSCSRCTTRSKDLRKQRFEEGKVLGRQKALNETQARVDEAKKVSRAKGFRESEICGSRNRFDIRREARAEGYRNGCEYTAHQARASIKAKCDKAFEAGKKVGRNEITEAPAQCKSCGGWFIATASRVWPGMAVVQPCICTKEPSLGGPIVEKLYKTGWISEDQAKELVQNMTMALALLSRTDCNRTACFIEKEGGHIFEIRRKG